ncbi:MAG: hypothetical protein ACLFVU_08465 [Phycisphaerae bacterium]
MQTDTTDIATRPGRKEHHSPGPAAGRQVVRDPRPGRIALVCCLGPAVAALFWAVLSDGFYHDDDIMHYLFAARGWDDWGALLDRWARPGYNIPAAVAARIGGLTACRILSVVETAVTSWLAWLIAARIAGRTIWTASAPLLVWAQPLVLTLSLTTLTETPAAMYLALGVWLYLRGNRVWACGFWSLLMVTRDETMALAPVIGAIVVIDAWRSGGGRWLSVPKTWWVWACAGASLWAVAAYWTAAWFVYDDLHNPANPLAIFLQRYGTEFGRGTWTHFLASWPLAAGLGVLGLATAGAVARPGRSVLVWIFPLGLLVLHTIIYARGMFASGGYPRFLVPAAGLLGALAGVGLQAVVVGRSRRAIVAMVATMLVVLLRSWQLGRHYVPAELLPMTLTVLIAILCVGALLVVLTLSGKPRLRRIAAVGAVGLAAAFIVGQFIPASGPLRLRDSAMHRVCLEALVAARRQRLDLSDALTQHCLITLETGCRHPRGPQKAAAAWERAEAGTLFIWDSKYGTDPMEPNGRGALEETVESLGRRIMVVRGDEPGCEIRLYVKRRGPTTP